MELTVKNFTNFSGHLNRVLTITDANDPASDWAGMTRPKMMVEVAYYQLIQQKKCWEVLEKSLFSF